MDHNPEDIRLTIRALVQCIQQSNKPSSPVEANQLAHIRKVIRFLSLTQQQIDELPTHEKESVLQIRASAVQKMRDAKSLQEKQQQVSRSRAFSHGACTSSSDTTTMPIGIMAPPPARAPTMVPEQQDLRDRALSHGTCRGSNDSMGMSIGMMAPPHPTESVCVPNIGGISTAQPGIASSAPASFGLLEQPPGDGGSMGPPATYLRKTSGVHGSSRFLG